MDRMRPNLNSMVLNCTDFSAVIVDQTRVQNFQDVIVLQENANAGKLSMGMRNYLTYRKAALPHINVEHKAIVRIRLQLAKFL